jgi:YegS/Rv2252/BmrU family lipid kinase
LRLKEAQYDLVVAVGGDGTVNQVARALLHSSVPMGIIPTGSGNGLARHLKIPLSIPKAMAILFNSHIVSIDSGSLNGYPFFCTAGIGFDANLANRFNKASMRGFPSYLALSAMEFVRHHLEKHKIFVDEQVFEHEAFLITFANCSQWGYNVCIAPGACVTDGLLDMVIWKKTPPVTYPFMAMRLLMKNIDHSNYIENIRGTSFRIERLQEGWVHVDGEHVQMGKELIVEVHPASLRVVVPCLFQ